MQAKTRKKAMYSVFAILILLSLIGIYFGTVGRLYVNYKIMSNIYIKTDSSLISHKLEPKILNQAHKFYNTFPNDYSKAILYSTEIALKEKIDQQAFSEFMENGDNQNIVVYEYCLLKLNVFNGGIDEEIQGYLPKNAEYGCDAELNQEKKEVALKQSV